jgi:hypothetical protein
LELSKIQIKIVRDNNPIWSHFCYVPSDIKNRFDNLVNTQNFLTNYWVALWAHSEFDLFQIDTPESIQTLKETIKNKYRERYPELYVDSNTDKQGWLRVWYTENMEKELKEIGR